jgi:hypothetical protein
MRLFVTATYRENPCDSNSPIMKLHLKDPYNGFRGHKIEDLKREADAHQLFVKTHSGCNGVNVIIFYSHLHRRWIATTKRDGSQCNNLLSLPIYFNSRENGKLYFQQCAI